jgi:hypothetical protein
MQNGVVSVLEVNVRGVGSGNNVPLIFKLGIRRQ